MSLDLYAKCEHLLGIEEATEALHDLYASVLEDYTVTSLLDIGCGRGGFMQKMAERNVACKGIDPSPVMVTSAGERGLDAECLHIGDATGEYDAAVAIFDVLNFLDDKQLEQFLDDVAKRLRPGGVFVADINTLHGFAEVAEGSMSVEEENAFLNVDAVFADNELHTTFTLFEEEEDGRYRKTQSTITQYFHPLKRFRKHPHLKLVENRTFSLYDTKDKMLFVFKKAE